MKTARLSACIEVLFRDESDTPEGRIRCAHAAGFALVEMWHWRNKDLSAIRAALDDTGLNMVSMIVEPQLPLVTPLDKAQIEQAVRSSAAAARTLAADKLIIVSGNALPGRPREPQYDALQANLALAAAVARDEGVTVLLEPLNSRIDHVGCFLDRTLDGIDLVRSIGSPALRLLYDVYHSIVMDEDTAGVIGHSGHLIGHVHIADAPGRHEPGTGAADLQAVLNWLFANGYADNVGLEYWPTGRTRTTLQASRALLH